jgi:hypothetical protein
MHRKNAFTKRRMKRYRKGDEEERKLLHMQNMTTGRNLTWLATRHVAKWMGH